MKIYGNGNQTRSFLYISDCIEIFYKIFLKNNLKNQVINIGNNKETTIKELANRIIKLTNSKSKIKFVKVNNKSKMKKSGYEDILRRVPSVKKQMNITKFKPQISLDEGLKKFMLSLR